MSTKRAFVKLKTEIQAGTLTPEELKQLTTAHENDETRTGFIEEAKKHFDSSKAK